MARDLVLESRRVRPSAHRVELATVLLTSLLDDIRRRAARRGQKGRNAEQFLELGRQAAWGAPLAGAVATPPSMGLVDIWIARLDAWVITLILAVAMIMSFVIGSWRGQRSPSPLGDTGEKYTDASLALLGLLLAFTFSMALNRYDDRHQAMVAETNAIGDLYTNATLLPEPARSEFQALLFNYTTHRLEGRRLGSLRNQPEGVMLESRQMQAKATHIVARMVEEQTPITVPLVNSLNAVTSSYASYLAAYRERLPGIVLMLLLLGSAIPAFLMGRQGATNTVHKSGPLAFGLLVTLVIYVTFDLNQPSGGLITVREEPLVDLLKSMSK